MAYTITPDSNIGKWFHWKYRIVVDGIALHIELRAYSYHRTLVTDHYG